MKGKLIVIDGTDGSGKGTQTKMLVDRLKAEGRKVELMDFPQYGKKSAALVEEYLNGKFGDAKSVGPYRASIFYACDRYAASFQIRQWLEEGKIVISNRYVSANMGHQAGKIKDPKERDIFLEWLENLEFNIFGIPKPDINILLFMPPRVGQNLVGRKLQTTLALFEKCNDNDYREKKMAEQRDSRNYIEGKAKDIHEADINHLKDAAEAFRYVAKKYRWTVIECAPKSQLLDVKEINNLVYEAVKKIM